MAHSYSSQGVAADGQLLLYSYDDKTLTALDNWPETVISQEGYEKTDSARGRTPPAAAMRFMSRQSRRTVK